MSITPPFDAQAAALLDHVLAQMQQHVEFLVSQDYISSADAATITSKLTVIGADELAPRTRSMSLSTTAPRAGALLPRRNVPVPPPRLPQARALWGYNEDSQDPDDLNFSKGDIIEIVTETNPDWWVGKVNGKQGLFPSNHVEKLSSSSSPPTSNLSAPGLRSVPPPPAPSTGIKRTYKPFAGAMHGTDAPPAPTGAQTNSLGLQQAAGQEEKKSKFGKYGNTMAHSAAGGVGFGAGAAIGGGLVRAIF